LIKTISIILSLCKATKILTERLQGSFYSSEHFGRKELDGYLQGIAAELHIHTWCGFGGVFSISM